MYRTIINNNDIYIFPSGPSSVNSVQQSSESSVRPEQHTAVNKEVPTPRTANSENTVDALSGNFYELNGIYSEEDNTKGLLATTNTFMPTSRDINKRKKQKDTAISPDLPHSENELAHMDIDDFNDLISQFDEVRQILLKDLRKKGKNKVAARNSRKRKMDVLDDLDTDVESLMKKQELLLHERQLLVDETRLIHKKTALLSDYILGSLHDEMGNPYSHSHTLEYTVDGNVYLVPLKDAEV